MNDILLLKPGELVLKGQNRHFFEDRLRSNVARRLKSLGRFQITSVQSTVYVEPLEDGIVSVARVKRQAQYQSSFMLVAAMNPCPCGFYGSNRRTCRCTPPEIRRYLDRVSGPLLDRIDLQIEVDSVPVNEINDAVPSESSAQVAERVRKAREIQLERYRGTGRHCNAQLTNTEVSRYCTPDAEGLRLLNMAVDSMHLSMRAYQRILKVSRTIADLAGEENIAEEHIAEAIQYRTHDFREG